jgi:hypothetical protein
VDNLPFCRYRGYRNDSLECLHHDAPETITASGCLECPLQHPEDRIPEPEPTVMLAPAPEINHSSHQKRLRQGRAQDPELPSLFTQIKNFAGAVAAFIVHPDLVTQEVFQARLAVCLNCEKLRSDNRCSVCGCFVEIKAQAETFQCPEGRWKE